jgi:hypothetical protein
MDRIALISLHNIPRSGGARSGQFLVRARSARPRTCPAAAHPLSESPTIQELSREFSLRVAGCSVALHGGMNLYA